MTTATYNQIAEAIGRRKTYSINDNLDVYTTRGGKQRKVFRVQWETLNYPTPQEYSKARHEARRKGRNVWITTLSFGDLRVHRRRIRGSLEIRRDGKAP